MPSTLHTPANSAVIGVVVDARKRSNIKQADLARALGKDQSWISNIENGHRRIDLVEFCAVARALKLDPVELFSLIVQRLPKDWRL